MGNSAEALCTALCIGESVRLQPEELCLALRVDSLPGEAELPEVEAMASCVDLGEIAFGVVSGIRFRSARATFVRSRRERFFREATLVLAVRFAPEVL